MPVQILVVDDDPLSREVLTVLLEHAGYAVETADSGDQALLNLRSAHTSPQVVLTDLKMPGASGDQLAQSLRGLCGPRTALVAMSASTPDDGSAQQFDAFLLKPFTIDALAAAIAGKAAEMAQEPNQYAAPVLDEAVYARLAGSMRRPQLKQLYALCLADAEKRSRAMRLAASGLDDDAYKREAHAIKGGCGMVGALELQTLATSMEQRGLNDDHVASLKEFLVACERLRGMLVAREIIQDQASRVSGEDA